MLIAYIPLGSDLFGPEGFRKIAVAFSWTWMTELACVVAVLISRLRRRLSGFSLPRSTDSSRCWILPIYVWGLQSVRHFGHTYSIVITGGLVDPPFTLVFDAIFEIMLALFTLVVVQSVAVVFLGGVRATMLGLHSDSHRAAVTVLVDLFLVLAFFLIINDLVTRRYGLPLPLT